MTNIVKRLSNDNRKESELIKVKLFEYECWHDDYGDKWCPQTYIASSAAKAKHQHYQYSKSDTWEDTFFNIIRGMKCKKLGNASLNPFYGDPEAFERMKLGRGIEFAQIGMRIFAAGKSGTIVGSNGSMNLDVVFDGECRISNVHPHWEIMYYDQQNNILADYCKRKVA